MSHHTITTYVKNLCINIFWNFARVHKNFFALCTGANQGVHKKRPGPHYRIISHNSKFFNGKLLMHPHQKVPGNYKWTLTNMLRVYNHLES